MRGFDKKQFKAESFFTLWLASRLLFSRNRKLLSMAGWISLAGLILGVGSLVVSMAVISGFESTLMKSVSDVAGHIQIFTPNLKNEPWKNTIEKIKKAEPTVLAGHRFAMVEGVLANKGKVSGIVIQGVDPDFVQSVLGIDSRITEGKFDLGTQDKVAKVLIGKGLAEDFHLKIGDEIRIIVPLQHDLEVTKFHRRAGVYTVSGILDLGKHEYNQRWVFSSISAAQQLADIGDRYSGLQLKIEDAYLARETALRLSKVLGSDFRVRDWKDVNENLFEAVKIEKVVIFFVIFIIVVAAAFNVASSLYVNVIRSYQQIAMLKALGFEQKKIVRVLSFQGFLLGLLGSLIGLLLGFLFCFAFLFLQKQFGLIQGGVYKVDFIYVQIRFLDIILTLAATLCICFVATLAPALRGARLTTVEGLRSE